MVGRAAARGERANTRGERWRAVSGAAPNDASRIYAVPRLGIRLAYALQQRGCITKERAMFSWAIAFFVIALIAAVFGFFGLAASAAGIAKIIFVVALILALVSFVSGRRPVV
jgi:uncharacterized membrane protein YtjA (UPF0391 family)